MDNLIGPTGGQDISAEIRFINIGGCPYDIVDSYREDGDITSRPALERAMDKHRGYSHD